MVQNLLKKLVAGSMVGGVLLGFALPIFAVSINGTNFVYDQAQIISEREEMALESYLLSIQQNTTAEIAVVTMSDLGGREPFTVAMNLARNLNSEIEYTSNPGNAGVGNAEFDNGIVVLIAPNERKRYIVTGRGIEGVIPDALAKRYGEQILVPAFREEDYGAGLLRLARAFSGAIAGEVDAWNEAGAVNEGVSLIHRFSIPLMLVLFFGPIVKPFFKTVQQKYIGSGIGTGLTTLIGSLFVGWGALWFLLPLFLLWLLVFFSELGGVGGGTGSSRSSFGGGFSGFGGGSFGGGGAGGSW